MDTNLYAARATVYDADIKETFTEQSLVLAESAGAAASKFNYETSNMDLISLEIKPVCYAVANGIVYLGENEEKNNEFIKIIEGSNI